METHETYRASLRLPTKRVNKNTAVSAGLSGGIGSALRQVTYRHLIEKAT